MQQHLDKYGGFHNGPGVRRGEGGRDGEEGGEGRGGGEGRVAGGQCGLGGDSLAMEQRLLQIIDGVTLVIMHVLMVLYAAQQMWYNHVWSFACVAPYVPKLNLIDSAYHCLPTTSWKIVLITCATHDRRPHMISPLMRLSTKQTTLMSIKQLATR